jgi:YVTN family beta-propeller protein
VPNRLVIALVCAAATFSVPLVAAESGYRVYVTNERSGTLSVIDGASSKVTATVALGKRPRGLKISPDGKLLYVALSGSPSAGPGVDESKLPPADKGADGIGVVDLATLKLVRVLRGVSDPEQLAVSRDGKRLYIASEDTGQAIILDAGSGARRAALPVGGEPEGVTLSPDGRFVYMTSESDHKISVIDTTSDKVVAQFEVGMRPRFIEFTHDSSRAFVSNELDASISVVDAKAHKVVNTFKLSGGPLIRPVGIIVSADGKRLYAVTGRGGTVVELDATTGKQLASAEVGQRPWGLALSPDDRLLYTANGPSNDVTVLDASTLKVQGRIAVGDSPWGVVADGTATRR